MNYIFALWIEAVNIIAFIWITFVALRLLYELM